MKLKALAIIVMIGLSMLPAYALYKYLQKKMRPRESMRRFLPFLIIVLALIFIYTFGVVFIIKMLFPGA